MRIAWLLFAALNADSELDYAARIRGLEARAAADGAARLLADPLRVVTNALTSSFELMPRESSDERRGALAALPVLRACHGSFASQASVLACSHRTIRISLSITMRLQRLTSLRCLERGTWRCAAAAFRIRQYPRPSLACFRSPIGRTDWSALRCARGGTGASTAPAHAVGGSARQLRA
jgi:hypothetical protein